MRVRIINGILYAYSGGEKIASYDFMKDSFIGNTVAEPLLKERGEILRKEREIEKIVTELIDDSCESMKGKIDRALNSGAVDVDGWDINVEPYLLPKTILIALLKQEINLNNGRGTSYEKQVKKDSDNIYNCI